MHRELLRSNRNRYKNHITEVLEKMYFMASVHMSGETGASMRVSG